MVIKKYNRLITVLLAIVLVIGGCVLAASLLHQMVAHETTVMGQTPPPPGEAFPTQYLPPMQLESTTLLTPSPAKAKH